MEIFILIEIPVTTMKKLVVLGSSKEISEDQQASQVKQDQLV
jgi:hypothetical protein